MNGLHNFEQTQCQQIKDKRKHWKNGQPPPGLWPLLTVPSASRIGLHNHQNMHS